MCEVLRYLIEESNLLIPPEYLEDVHRMDHYHWQKFVDRIKGRYMINLFPVSERESKLNLAIFYHLFLSVLKIIVLEYQLLVLTN